MGAVQKSYLNLSINTTFVQLGKHDLYLLGLQGKKHLVRNQTRFLHGPTLSYADSSGWKKNGKNNRSLWDHGFVFEQLGGILNS